MQCSPSPPTQSLLRVTALRIEAKQAVARWQVRQTFKPPSKGICPIRGVELGTGRDEGILSYCRTCHRGHPKQVKLFFFFNHFKEGVVIRQVLTCRLMQYFGPLPCHAALPRGELPKHSTQAELRPAKG